QAGRLLPNVRSVLRALALGPGRSAAQAAAPSYAVLLVVSLILFGGNGLHPHTVVSWALQAPARGVLLFAAWALFAGRAYRAALRDSSWELLRTVPLSWFRLSVGGALLAL